MNKLQLEILDPKRLQLLPLLGELKKQYYLAGGTGLALQIGHRKSVDFDFFTEQSFDTTVLFNKCSDLLSAFQIKKIQDEENTLTILIDEEIKISFFKYPYALIKPLIDSEYLNIASIEDIGCMKLSTITQRATIRDYVDIYFILQQIDLEKLIEYTHEKYSTLDKNFILKSLVYFEDLEQVPLEFMPRKEVSFSEVEHFIQDKVKEIALS